MKKYLDLLNNDSYVIFLFHGVIDFNDSPVRNYTHKHMRKDRFNSFIKLLSSLGNPVSMDDIYDSKYGGPRLPNKSFAVTFDDGFENNYSIAAPILNAYKVPTTFYITSNFIDNNTLSWMDTIEHAISVTKKNSISLSFLNKKYSLASIEMKLNFLNEIRKVIKGDKNYFLNRAQLVQEVLNICNVDENNIGGQNLDMKMSWGNVKELDSNPLFTIGCHTHTHPIMSYLDEESLYHEINFSLDMIRNKIDNYIHHFSYPEGQKEHYNEKVISCLKSSKIKMCPTAITGLNRYDACMFNLKRVTVI